MNDLRGFTPHYEFSLRIERNDDTVLDVTLGTRHDKAEIERAVSTLRGLLEEYRPQVTPALMPEATTHTAPDYDPEPEAEAAPAPAPEQPSGVTGVLHIKCPKCDRLFGAFTKEPITEIGCNCGHVIQLERDTLAKFEYDCPYCEKHRWGLTNREDPEIEVQCVCKSRVTLTWDAKNKIYRN